MTLTPFFATTMRYHTNSLPYNLRNIRSYDALFMELDFHQPRIVCGNTTTPLYELFDTDCLTVTLDFAMRMQDTLLGALAFSFILTARERSFITMVIHKHQYSFYCMIDDRRGSITRLAILARYLHTAFSNSQATAPSAPVHIEVRATFCDFRPVSLQHPCAGSPAVPTDRNHGFYTRCNCLEFLPSSHNSGADPSAPCAVAAVSFLH